MQKSDKRTKKAQNKANDDRAIPLPSAESLLEN